MASTCLRSWLAVGLALGGAVCLADDGPVASTIDAAEALAKKTGRPILAVAGTAT